jgi:hypothetical protein
VRCGVFRTVSGTCASAPAGAIEQWSALRCHINRAVKESVERRRNDPKFKAWVKRIIEEDRDPELAAEEGPVSRRSCVSRASAAPMPRCTPRPPVSGERELAASIMP